MNIELETLNVLRDIIRVYRETGAPPDMQEFWPPEAKDLHAELSDLRTLVSHLTETYDHFSGGRISKPMTLPAEVFAVAEELENERVDRDLCEALDDINQAFDSCGVPRTVEVAEDGSTITFSITDRLEILALRSALSYGIRDASDLARRIAICLVPTPAHMRADETKRENIKLTIQPMIDRAWKKIIKVAKEEARSGL